MKDQPTLNNLYRAINLALGIERPRQFEILQTIPGTISKSVVSGFSRNPDDNRYKAVQHDMLIKYCLALATQPDLLALGVQPDLEGTAKALREETTPSWEKIDIWEGVSLRMGRGKIKDRLEKPRKTIRR